MMLLRSLLLAFTLYLQVSAQQPSPEDPDGDGYIGYSLKKRGDPESVIYETESTPRGVEESPIPPDVYLNASVHVGEIFIGVDNLTAKVNLDAQVLKLLEFNAGVDASIEKVTLLIQNVTAKVELEARLGNLVKMIGDVLESLDLNPLVATIGQSVGSIADDVVDLLDGDQESEGTSAGGSEGGGESTLERRDFKQDENILYSVNDYSGNAHTNRVLEQDGTLVDQFLRNDGAVYSEKTVGDYKSHMEHSGLTRDVVRNGKELTEMEYVYKPFVGLTVVAAVFLDGEEVVETRVLAESGGGGSSTISGEYESDSE